MKSYEPWKTYHGILIERRKLDETTPDGRPKYCYEPWKTYRGILIERRKLDETTPDGRPKYCYTAMTPCWKNPLYSRSQAGIKAQIGRSLNGFPPCDCLICVHWMKGTPITPAHCNLDRPKKTYETCDRFEVNA